MGTPYLTQIIQDVDLALKALEIIYRANGSAVEVLVDIDINYQVITLFSPW